MQIAAVAFTLRTLDAKICSVKLEATFLLSSFLIVHVVASCATVLPELRKRKSQL
jgi:hypothetical protein